MKIIFSLLEERKHFQLQLMELKRARNFSNSVGNCLPNVKDILTFTAKKNYSFLDQIE